MRIFVTGHTGFKGAWLTMILKNRGHEVFGYALEPEANSLFTKASLATRMEGNIIGDIRNRENLQKALNFADPEAVIHLAAQPLVRKSYEDPIYTYEVNVNGTLNLLSCMSHLKNLQSLLVVTTDKVYKEAQSLRGYSEEDALGGFDPYSNSKAMSDLLSQSWMNRNVELNMAIARAGNVIGGGDICEDRLVPDLVSAYSHQNTPILRNPSAIRPWQHVLDCLSGYLVLIDNLSKGRSRGVWNFGPSQAGFHSVADVAEEAAKVWGVTKAWEPDLGNNPHESGVLRLDTTKANTELLWRDKLSFQEAIRMTISWYKDVANGWNPYERTLVDIESYSELH